MSTTNPYGLPRPIDEATVRRQFDFILRRKGPGAFDFGNEIWSILRDDKREWSPENPFPTEEEFREAFYGTSPKPPRKSRGNVIPFVNGGAA